MNCSMPGLPVYHQLLEFTQTHIHRVCDSIEPSHLLLSPPPPALNPSQHQSLFHESTLHMRWPKYWSFSFSISPSKEHPRTVALQAPLSVGFPRQEYWSKLPFLFPGDLPDPGIGPLSSTLAGRFFTRKPS